MSLTEMITEHAQHFIEVAGYGGAAALMALESMIAPVPSEAVMPFVGMLVKQGKMDLTLALLATSVGSIVGSLISYWLGAVGGKPLVMKVGKYMFINEHHLDKTIAWFHKGGGSWTVFFARFVPVVRHLISVPAGMGRMPLGMFCVTTLAGATLWNGLLLWVGYQWQDHVAELSKYYKKLDIVVIVAGVLVVGIWFYVHMKKPAKADGPPAETKQSGD